MTQMHVAEYGVFGAVLTIFQIGLEAPDSNSLSILIYSLDLTHVLELPTLLKTKYIPALIHRPHPSLPPYLLTNSA